MYKRDKHLVIAEWNELGIPNNILRTSRLLRIIILGHVPAAAAARGVDLALDGRGLERYGVEVRVGVADVAFAYVSDTFICSRCWGMRGRATHQLHPVHGTYLRGGGRMKSDVQSP